MPLLSKYATLLDIQKNSYFVCLFNRSGFLLSFKIHTLKEQFQPPFYTSHKIHQQKINLILIELYSILSSLQKGGILWKNY